MPTQIWNNLKAGIRMGRAQHRAERGDREALWEIDAGQLEILCCESLRALGWEVFTGGRDASGVLRFPAFDRTAQLGHQIRRVSVLHRAEVDDDAIRQALEAVDSNGKAVVMASGYFSDEAQALAKKTGAQLIDGEALAAILARRRRARGFAP